MTELPPDFPVHVIEREIGYGEKILWCGRPRQGVFLRRLDAVVIPVSLLWSGIALFEMVRAIDRQRVDVGAVVVVLTGFYVLFGRFVVDAGQRAKTFYVSTEQQIIIVSGALRAKVEALRLRGLQRVSLSLGRRGRGTILLGALGRWNRHRIPGLTFGKLFVPQFDSIDNASEVYEQIRSRVQP